MLNTIIQKNRYIDSIVLMLLTGAIEELPGVEQATVMMGTPANRAIIRQSGFGTDELDGAGPNDLVIVYRGEGDQVRARVLEAVEKILLAEAVPATGGEPVVSSWRRAGEIAADCNLCLISVPGEYAADEAQTALEAGKHVMLFSDNVSLEEERRLKEAAHQKGLLVMGPDCGTSVIGGVPLAFSNVVRRGGIGIVGASGTGVQEIMSTVHQLGMGISHAVGVGGRDLSAEVGGISTLDALRALEEDPETGVIVLVSKPPAPGVREDIIRQMQMLDKPVVALFLGDAPCRDAGNLYFAYTLREAAARAALLAGGTLPEGGDSGGVAFGACRGAYLMGLYTGGTLAYEAAMLVGDSTGIHPAHASAGCVLRGEGCEILDLGDDVYTRGKPHPMIDPAGRNRLLRGLTDDDRDLVVLLDVILGYGACADPGGQLARVIREVKDGRGQRGLKTEFVVNLLGTGADPQGLDRQRHLLEEAGALVYSGNEQAVTAALTLLGHRPVPPQRQALAAGGDGGAETRPPRRVPDLLRQAPAVLNIGLQQFARVLQEHGERVVSFQWRPVPKKGASLRGAMAFLETVRLEGPYGTVDEANRAVIERVKASSPFLVDVVPAGQAAEVLRGKTLLHAGPPIHWGDMTHPMRGSCVGAALLEGWADSEAEAWALLERGEVEFVPCHQAGFVGPMGGITSGSMPVLKVLNTAGGNYAYCTLNEGIGSVLRFGAYSPEVIRRLQFLRDTLGPVLGQALRRIDGGLNVNVAVSKAIAMGDEFHQRNIAASLVFLKEMAPIISGLDLPSDTAHQVIRFLADTDQFFLNIMMAAAKSVMDYAAAVGQGTVVTAMSRNGHEFGIRLSGTGDTWFTGPVNTPQGLYFAGYGGEDANPDMGDSAITETFGVGGMAMVAAPAVTKFVGSGGFHDALRTSEEMAEICLGHNPHFPVPTWNFQGICLGIDARRVVDSGILPVINTGIAHRRAGVGQIGAGTVRPPMACFTRAVEAYARKLGFAEDSN